MCSCTSVLLNCNTFAVLGAIMNKAYTFRLDPSLISQLDVFDGSRTSNIRNAIQGYCDSTYNGNTNYIQHLNEEVDYLRSQNNALMVTKLPLLQQWINKLKSR